MPDNYYSEVNDHGDVIPIKDLAAMTWKANAKTGVHQWLPLTLAGIKALNSARTWEGNVTTHNGITFTVNTNANGYVTSISTSGTASSFAFLRLTSVASFSGNFKLNGGVDNDRYCYIQNETTNTGLAYSYGGDADITLSPTANVVNCIVAVNQGGAGGVTFYPLLRLAEDNDPTFTPYAMTNEELTNAVTPVAGTITTDFTLNTYCRLHKIGKMVIARVIIDSVTKDAFTAGICVIPEGFRPDVFTVVSAVIGGATPAKAMIGADGTVQSSVGLTNQQITFDATWITA